jgi:hypothetical protein
MPLGILLNTRSPRELAIGAGFRYISEIFYMQISRQLLSRGEAAHTILSQSLLAGPLIVPKGSGR